MKAKNKANGLSSYDPYVVRRPSKYIVRATLRRYRLTDTFRKMNVFRSGSSNVSVCAYIGANIFVGIFLYPLELFRSMENNTRGL